MLFVDYENFDISRNNLYRNKLEYHHAPFIDLVAFPNKLVTRLEEQESLEIDLLKTFLFVPKPDEFLMKEDWRAKRYNFLKGLENTNYLTVISGRHTARPSNGIYADMNLDDKSTYFVNEKGTDINIATQLLTKAFHNSYDVAIVVSGDTDYLPVYDVLNTFGKLVIVVGVEGQRLTKLKKHTDLQHIMDFDFLQTCESQR